MSTIDPIEVTVAGGTIEANTLVYGVVQTALDEAGFTDITVKSPHGDAECDAAEMPSLLDLIRTKNPSMFDMPVRVTQHASMDAVGALPNAGATAAAIATVVYGGVLDEAVVEEAAMIYVEEDTPGEEVPDDIPF
jgi:hypothetical protein